MVRPGGGGGVTPYGQPDRKISAFFLTTSLSRCCTINYKYKYKYKYNNKYKYKYLYKYT